MKLKQLKLLTKIMTMKTPTFQEQYNKITRAYFKKELNPMDGCACFIGNLLNNKNNWEETRFVNTGNSTYKAAHERLLAGDSHMWNKYLRAVKFIHEESAGLYSEEEIIRMENNFLSKCFPEQDRRLLCCVSDFDEENLFLAMESTLLMLRAIHESKGEVVKDYSFTQRELQPV